MQTSQNMRYNLHESEPRLLAFRMPGGTKVGSAQGFLRGAPPLPAAADDAFPADDVLASFLSFSGFLLSSLAFDFPLGSTVDPSSLCPVVVLNTLSLGGGSSASCRCLGGAMNILPQLAARFTQPGYLPYTPSRLATAVVNC